MAELSNTQVVNDDKAGGEQYWYQCYQKLSEEGINSMPSWLIHAKEIVETITEECQNFDIDLLNISQRKAYGIVENHYRNPQKQLLMIIKGLTGSGKTFVVDATRSLLKQCCIVTAFFGTASFNVRALVKLQEDLNSIHYLVNDEFSVVAQKMLGWIDRRCRQGIGRFAQLPPSWTKYYITNNQMKKMKPQVFLFIGFLIKL